VADDLRNRIPVLSKGQVYFAFHKLLAAIRAAKHDIVAVVVVVLLVATVGAHWHIEHVANNLRLPHLSMSGSLLAIASLACDAIVRLVPLMILCGILFGLHRRRTALTFLVAGLSLYLLWFGIDVRIKTLTGRSVMTYATLLTQPDVGEWAGGTRELLRELAIAVVQAIALAILVVLLCFGMTRAVTRYARPAYRRGLVTTIITLAAALFVVRLAVAFVTSVRPAHFDEAMASLAPVYVEHAQSRMQYSPFGLAFTNATKAEAERVFPMLSVPPLLETVGPLPGDVAPPHVLLITVESWRHDMLTPQHMPRLSAIADRGWRLDRHYAGSNLSHMGLFTLLYGRASLFFDATLNAGAPSPWMNALRTWGYERTYRSGMRHEKFARMDEYIKVGLTFDRVEQVGKKEWHLGDLEWPQLDRDVAAATREQLWTATSPQFVNLFIASTHYPYLYPPAYERHRPVISDRQSLLLKLRRDEHQELLNNRYLNAVAFIDDVIADLIDSIDLTKTIVIVTGDHGESLWDDGALFHGSKPSEAQCATPCFLTGGTLGPRRITTPTTHADLAPTVTHLITHGHKRLAGTTGSNLASTDPLPLSVLLYFPPSLDARSTQLLIEGDERILVRFHDRRPAVAFLGMIDRSGDPAGDEPPSPDHVDRWGNALRTAIEDWFPVGG
jgi:hypothetical protein